MSFTEKINNELAKPLNAIHIATRDQSGQKLSYIEGHHAIREANRIFGFDGWTRETARFELVQQEVKAGNKGDSHYVGYTCLVTVRAGDVLRTGVGFGQGIDRDLGRAHESAIKEAETDAMKRALMTFGDPFGLALYDKKQEHVEKAEPKKVADGEPWVRSLIGEHYAAYVEHCKRYGFDPIQIAKDARGAQVRDGDGLSQYVEDRAKREAVHA